MTILLAIAVGALIGLSIGLALGALGGGGCILAVLGLVYLLNQDAGQATTGSLVVVGVTSLIGAVTAHRAGNVMLGRGVTFGAVAIGGAAQPRVGLLTGFLGVCGGFLVVPALVLALALPMTSVAGTSLVVITLTSAAALAVRADVGATPDWTLVAARTAASAAAPAGQWCPGHPNAERIAGGILSRFLRQR